MDGGDREALGKHNQLVVKRSKDDRTACASKLGIYNSNLRCPLSPVLMLAVPLEVQIEARRSKAPDCLMQAKLTMEVEEEDRDRMESSPRRLTPLD